MMCWSSAALLLMPLVSCYIEPSDTEPDCPAIQCFNNGELSIDTCTCICDDKHTGFFCETELQDTAWPLGRYSLLSTVFGCPEPDNYGWHSGYINLTLAGEERPAQRWKMPFRQGSMLTQNTQDPHILGPYHLRSLQLNFCSRLDPEPDPDPDPDPEGDDRDSTVWPNGTYCVFKSGISCMKGFSENSVLLSGYHTTWSDTDGVLPNVSMTTNSTATLTLSYCCRTGGTADDVLDLPHEFPFMLLKKRRSSCNQADKMAVYEERFDLVDDLDSFRFEGQDSIFTKITGGFQRLGLCYYEKTAVRECFHTADQGWSYVGSVNVSADGEPCMNWYDVDEEFRPHRNWVGDDFTQNHCRTPQSPYTSPQCFVNNNTDWSLSLRSCDVPECEVDPELVEVGTSKPVYSVQHLDELPPENAVDGITFGVPFQNLRPLRKPWIQVDLEESFLVYGVKVWRRYVFMPANFRFVGVHVSHGRWDFINYGALQCEKRRNPRKAKIFLFMCYRAIAGQFVTIRNFDDPSPDTSWGGDYFNLAISEITVLVKRTVCSMRVGLLSGEMRDVQLSASGGPITMTVCTRRLGLLSGEVRDFQLSGSGDTATTVFERGRLLLPGQGWCGGDNAGEQPFFMVDLIVPTVVSGLEIQGWMDDHTVVNVQEFTLDTAVKQDVFKPYLDPVGQTKANKVYPDQTSPEELSDLGNKLFRIDTTLPPAMVKRIMLYRPMVARYVRVNIVSYSGPQPCLKLELIGCPKRVTRDLYCGQNSTFFGYDVLRRSAFWIAFDAEYDVNVTTCLRYCTESLTCASTAYQPGTCKLLRTSRYNPRLAILSELENFEYQTSAKLCVKDIQETKSCSGLILEPGELRSPSYPFFYGHLITCMWYIHFAPGTHVRVSIKHLHFAAMDTPALLKQNGIFDISPGPCTDRLLIDELVIYIDNEAEYEGAVLVSRSDVEMVALISCARYTMSDASGFLLEVSRSDYPGCRSGAFDCLAECRAPAAIVTSPAHPVALKPGTNCRWNIRGELGQFVELHFKVMDIKDSTRSCDTSYVGVIDVNLHGVKTRLGAYCSYNLPIERVRSSWHVLELQLDVGREVIGTGFMAEYHIVDYVKHNETTLKEDNEGCSSWQSYGDHCYELFEDVQGITWLTAARQCDVYGGYLASIASPGEARFIHAMMTRKLLDTSLQDPSFYIGLRKIGSGERYVNYQWLDGSPLTYTAWYRDEVTGQSQPDGLENERCTRLVMTSINSLNTWHDVACAFANTRMYICERHKTAFTNGNGNETSNASEASFELNSELSMLYTSPVFEHVGPEYFHCDSGEFVLQIYVCDGHTDCMDGSDEGVCDGLCNVDGGVHNNVFVCDSGQCVPMEQFCDFRHDCDDGSDESQCVLAECLESEWRCKSGQCIPGQYRCDVKHDCFDGSDEENCDTCQPLSSFQCHDQRCVAASRVCDSYSDCSGRFNEDEAQGCSAVAQSSCVEWYAIGARKNGSYLINLATSNAFEVECRFTGREDGTILVQTLVHHDYEATVTWTPELRDIKTSYPATRSQLTSLKARSGGCKQYFSAECSYLRDGMGWTGDDGLSMESYQSTPDCACPYVGECDGGENHRCNCSKMDTPDWFGLGHDEYLVDSGYVRSLPHLPISYLWQAEIGSPHLPALRTTIGPLICEEEITVRSDIQGTMVCDDDNLADVSGRCVLDFDEFGETMGCRDLSHIQACGNETCPANHARCNDGHCLPYYRMCDGVKHCSGGEDERNCELKLACQNSLSCRRSSICVPSENVCDGVIHCPLGDDERLCNKSCIGNCSCDLDAMYCEMEDYLMVFATLYFETFRSTRGLILKNSYSFNVEFNATALTRLPYLIHLNMSAARITFLHPYQFEANTNLISLNLSANLISVLYENTFHGLGKLKYLFLTGNPLYEIEPLAFNGLGSLSSLDLTGLALRDLIPGMFTGLSLLAKLNLSNSRIISVDRDTFADLHTLRTLDVRYNEISEFDEGIFRGLIGLEYIYSSDFTLCCLRPGTVREENCLPTSDEFSSCDDLMRNQVLRAFLWIIGGLALIGNIAVLVYRFIVDKQGLGKTYGVFVSNLGVADFLMGVYLVILAVADTVFRGSYVWNDHHWRNGVVCRIAGVLSVLGSEGSVIFLCLITLDRILVVKFPFGNVRISRNVCFGICICVWAFLLLLALVPLSSDNYFQGSFYSRSAVCLALPLTRDRPPGFEYSIAVFVVFNLTVFMVIAVAQISIYREVIASRGKLTSKGRRNDMTIARNLFLVALTDFLCWFPVGVMGVMALSGRVISGEVYAWTAVFVLPINSALNPFIYTIGAELNKARTNKKSTTKEYRQPKGGFMDMTDVFRTRYYHFERKATSGKITLMDLTSKRSLAPMETLCVATRLAKALQTLHCADLVHGALTVDKVYLKDTAKGLTKIAVLTTPTLCKREEELANDVRAYGDTMKHVLKFTNSELI